MEWARKYGNIFSFKVLGHTYIVLNSALDVRQILMKRGAQCAGRMRYIMFEHAGWENDIHLVSPAGLKIMKQFAAKTIGPSALPQFVDAVDREVIECVKRIIRHEGPVDPRVYAKRMTGGLVLRIAYGYEVKSDDDRFVKMSEQAFAMGVELVTPGWLVDMVPLTIHLPAWMHGPKFMQTVKRSREIVHAMRTAPIDWVKEQIAGGTAEPSLAADLLASHEQENNELLFALLADFYAAGTDTTLSIILTLFLILALYPEVQTKAQAEVDSVTLGERLPKYSDRERLPYVTALVKELYRFPGVLNAGFPHRITQDIEYEGYIFPENALVMANIWSILHDPVKYPDPFTFNPERYIGNETNVFGPDDIVNEDPTRYIFGFEPRRCLGRHLVESALFVLAAKLLATCNISCAVNERGESISPTEIQYTGDFISRPVPYTCSVQPRPNARTLLFDE